MEKNLESYTVVPQSYGIAMAQNSFGGPSGVWLDCHGGCRGGGKLRGPDPHSLTDGEAVAIFRKNGWLGEGPTMKRARCPSCAKQES